MNNTTMEAAAFFETYLPDALSLALEYAGSDGFVASLPQLLRARVSADFDNEIWRSWFFSSNSEESVVTKPDGSHAVVFVHGGGIFAQPSRFKELYHASVDRRSANGFTGLFGAKIHNTEAESIQKGKLADGSQFPIYSFEEIRQGVANLPRRYGVIMDFEMARDSACGFARFDELSEDPVMVARCGGSELALAYLQKSKEFYRREEMGSGHRDGDINPTQSQTWVPFLFDCLGGASDYDSLDPDSRFEGDSDSWFTHYRVSRDAGYGIRADSALINTARYIGVAPIGSAAGVRDLSFNL